MEKNPLFHFYPATPILSIATAGCKGLYRIQSVVVVEVPPISSVAIHIKKQ